MSHEKITFHRHMKPSSKPSPKPPSIASIARDHKVSRETARRWRDEGADLADVKIIARLAADVHRRNQPQPEGIGELKRRKLAAEARLAEIKALTAEKEMVLISKANECMARIGSATRGTVMRLEADLPPMLEGLDPSRMQKVIRAKVDEMLLGLSDATSDAWTEATQNF